MDEATWTGYDIVWVLVLVAVAFVALWVWAARRNVLQIDRELEAARSYATVAMLKAPCLDWFKEELYRPALPKNPASDSLFLTMQIVFSEDTTRLTAEWAEETDPGLDEGQVNGKEKR